MTPLSQPAPPVIAGGDDVVARLRRLGEVPVERAVAARHLAAIDRPRAGRRRRAAVVGVVGGVVLLGSTSLAAAGVLPAPAQSAAHETLGRIGIEVPETSDDRSPQATSTGLGRRPAEGRGLGGASGAESRRRLGPVPVENEGAGDGEASTWVGGSDDEGRRPRSGDPRSDTSTSGTAAPRNGGATGPSAAVDPAGRRPARATGSGRVRAPAPAEPPAPVADPAAPTDPTASSAGISAGVRSARMPATGASRSTDRAPTSPGTIAPDRPPTGSGPTPAATRTAR